ncbi:hypothetical protein GCM10027418_14870 [Mariniluteicoccus endophyticus]
MNRTLCLAAAALAATALVGCSSKPEPVTVAGPTRVSTPTTGAVATTPPAMTAGPSASTDPSATPMASASVTDVKVTQSGDRVQVSGRLLDGERRPIIGAVGDFFLDGSPQNLVQSYATKEDGTFSATFTTRELPPEATLMMHYRGDSTNAAGTFLIRKGTPRPNSAPPTSAAPATSAAAHPGAPTTPAPAASARAVGFTDLDGNGQPTVTVTGQQAKVTGRLITTADGRPVRNATVTWKVGNDATGQGQTGGDGAFELTVEAPQGAHEIVLEYAGTPDRSPATVRLTF